MFAYCNNNPITCEDAQGHSATLAGCISGGLFGFGSAVYSELTDDEEGIRWDKVAKCTLSSAAAGAFAGFVADVSIASCGVVPAIFISAGGGAFAAAGNSAYTQYTLTGEINLGKVISDGVLGGVTNGLCTGTSSQFEPVVKCVKDGLRYVGAQVTTEIAYGVSNLGQFMVNDLLPTVVTGFGAWYGGLAYDYLTK